MLTVSDAVVRYGSIEALHRISFNVEDGEIVTLLGANGAGKSTLLHSHVPEGRRVFPRMTVEENLEMGAFRRSGPLRDDIEQIYTQFPILKERRKQPGANLSGGEQQMLAIGRALMSKPRLLLLDEPSMGLAPMIVETIFSIIGQIREAGTTVFVVEQNATQALRLADRGYVMENGRIVFGDTAKNLLTDQRVRAVYLGESVEGE